MFPSHDQELHKDGDQHLHAVVFLNKKYQKTVYNKAKTGIMDLIGKNCNCQTARSKRKTLEYVMKEGNYISLGKLSAKDYLKALQEKTGVKSKIVAQKLLEGEKFDNLLKENPGFFLKNLKKIKDFETHVKQMKVLEEKKKEWKEIKINNKWNEEDKEIAKWLNKNIKKPRVFKQKHLYIWGETNHGKSTLLNNLAEYLRIYDIPKEEDFYDFYEDGKFDLMSFDEFRGGKRPSSLNRFIDGSPYTFRKKGTQAIKTDNLPLIILANDPLSMIYSKFKKNNPNMYEAFEKRFKIICVLDFIQVLLKPKK
jgi:hypothetical protein